MKNIIVAMRGRVKKIFFNPLNLATLSALLFNPIGFNIFEIPRFGFVSTLLGLTILGAVIIFFTRRKIEITFSKGVFFVLMLWIISLILSTVFSVAPDLSFWGSYNRQTGLYAHFIFAFLFIFYLSIFKDAKEREIFLKILITVAFITSIIAILQKWGFYGMSYNIDTNEYIGRSFSTLGHPAFFGQFLLLPIWACVYFIKKSPKNQNILYYALLAVLIFALLLSANRASILGLSACLILMFIIDSKFNTVQKTILSLGAISGLIMYIVFFASSLRSLSSRFYIWKGAVSSFLDKPIIGSGLETFEIAFQKVFPPELFYYEQLYSLPDRAHNEWLDILVTMGIFGFISYGLIIFGILFLAIKKKRLLQTNHEAKILLFAFLSILISNLFGFPLTIHYILFIALLAMLLNLLADTETKIFKLNIKTVFISGMLSVMAIFMVGNSYKLIYADTLFARGYSKLSEQSVEAGTRDLEKAMKLNKNQGELFLYFSDALLTAGKEFNNEEIIEQALYVNKFASDFFNDDFRSKYYSGKILTALGRAEEAEKAFTKAHELAPKNTAILLEWGKFYYENKNYNEAIERFEEILTIIPNYWTWKPDLHLKTDQEKETYRLFFKHAPDIQEMFKMLYLSYSKIGTQEKADFHKQYL